MTKGFSSRETWAKFVTSFTVKKNIRRTTVQALLFNDRIKLLVTMTIKLAVAGFIPVTGQYFYNE